jgi:uncharacterized protein YegP (UPF0339 family)
MAATVPDIAKVEVAIVELTNTFRRENRLGEVRPNIRLTETARAYAAFLARTGAFSHSADGRSPADRIKTGGYQFCLVAENLSLNLDSRGFETRQLATDAVEGWKRSPGHRRNMLAEHVTEIGVGVARASDKEQYLSVQVFGRPDSLKYTFVIRNQSQSIVAYAIDDAGTEVRAGYEVRHTACKPTNVTFTERRINGTAKPMKSRYETRAGDIFTLRGQPNGDIDVDHVGAGQALSAGRQDVPR